MFGGVTDSAAEAGLPFANLDMGEFEEWFIGNSEDSMLSTVTEMEESNLRRERVLSNGFDPTPVDHILTEMLADMPASKVPNQPSNSEGAIAPDVQEEPATSCAGTPKRKRRYTTADCDVCQKKFFRKYEMMRHKRATHLNLRPFQCTLCPQKFSRKAHLKLHLGKIHRAPNAAEMVRSICAEETRY